MRPATLRRSTADRAASKLIAVTIEHITPPRLGGCILYAMRAQILLIFMLAALTAVANDRPAGMTVHTWVREEIFAGYMANDVERFDKGVAKLDTILAAKPDDVHALAWRGSADVYRAVLARKAGKPEEYRKLYDNGMATMAKARELAPRDVGVIVISAVPLFFGDQLDPADRNGALQLGRKMNLTAMEAQKAGFEKLPAHFRGELWSGVAFAADRLGDREERDRILKTIIEQMPGTPYKTRAEKWLASDSLPHASYMCLSCHEPGRLDAVVKRLEARKQ